MAIHFPDTTIARFANFGLVIRSNVTAFFKSVRRRPRRAISYTHPWFSWDRLIGFALLIALLLMVADPLVTSAFRTLPATSIAMFSWVTQAGASHWYIVPVAVILLLCLFADWTVKLRDHARHIATLQWQVAAILTAVAGSGTLVNLIKRIIGRARPRHFEDMGPHAFEPFAFSAKFASFPSGHSTTAGAVALLLAVFYPRFQNVWIMLAVTVALSRVVVGAHYASDVILGLAFGAVFSWVTVVYFANRGLGFEPAHTQTRMIQPKQVLTRPFKEICTTWGAALRAAWRQRLPDGDNISMKPTTTDRIEEAVVQKDGGDTGRYS